MIRTALLSPVLVVLVAASAPAQGAIFTSTKTASSVNENLFKKKTDVYLNGGPMNGNCGQNGLPDGNYFFQVTNPSGSVLLSSDDITNRIVTVGGGGITATKGSHKTGNGMCDSTTVQLYPYDDTPNGGGEYKVWLTPIANYDWDGGGFHGFISKFSKTDNFKIKGPGKPVDQTTITGMKFFDRDLDTYFEPLENEEPIPGWRIEIYKNGILDGVTFTDGDGNYQFLRDMDDTEYLIVEVAPDAGFIPAPGAIWLATTPIMGLVTATSGQTVVDGPDFGNVSFTVIPGAGRTKGFWHNQNGKILLAECDPIWRMALNELCLRHPDGMEFTVSLTDTFDDAFDALSNFLVGEGVHGSAANQLSTQLAAAVLNNLCGFMQGTIYVDVGNDGVLVSLESLIEGARNLLCDENAFDTGPQTPFQELRDNILNCLNEYVQMNETGNLENPQIVYGVSEDPEEFESPYGDDDGEG